LAENIRFRVGPVHPVASCTSAHNAGDLVMEGGKAGVAVETNAATEPNTLITHGVVYLPVPGSLAVGQKLYAASATPSAGTTIQAIGTLTAGTKTAAPANFRSAATTSVLTTTTSNLLIGTMRTASTTDGASTMAEIELAPQ
jgi:predicted RecA/RadA family phage recombinase